MVKTKQQKAIDFLINNGVIIVMFILVIYTGITNDRFLTSNNLFNILMNMSSRLVIALGIAGCVITAGCDLSAGRMIGFAACIAGTLLQKIDYSGKFFPDMQPLNIFVALLIFGICIYKRHDCPLLFHYLLKSCSVSYDCGILKLHGHFLIFGEEFI